MNPLRKLTLITFTFALASCSVLQFYQEPEDAPPPADEGVPTLPSYVSIPHPNGFDLADLRGIFSHSTAPHEDLTQFAETCDAPFKQLLGITNVPEELNEGASVMVKEAPEQMHWCFYSKILTLQEFLKSDAGLKKREQKILDTYSFLSPLANAYYREYKDSRYLRWAAQYYSKLSEWVFYRKMTPTPESTLLLTTGSRSELEPWVPESNHAETKKTVFSKYGISFEPSIAGAKNPLGEGADRGPASSIPAPPGIK